MTNPADRCREKKNIMKTVKFLVKAMTAACMSAVLFVACGKENETEKPGPETPGTTPETVLKLEDLNNQGAFNGSVFDLKSVVYTTEEVEGSTVFYLSPTADLTDVEGMEEAADYIRLVVGKTNGGNTVFAGTDNAISYGTLSVDASNSAEYKISRLDVVLWSPTAAEIQISVASNDGKTTLLTNYYGACVRWPSEDIEAEAVAVCNEVAQMVYFGQGIGTNAHEYDLLVATSPLSTTTDGTLVLLEETGYAMHLAFFAIPNSTYRTRLPQGTYKYSENAEAGTYLSVSYLAEFSTENGHQTMTTKPFDGNIIVSTNSDDITTIRAYFLDESNRRRMIAFRGKLGSFMDYTSQSTYLPQFNEDVVLTAGQASGIYYGQMGEKAYGAFEIVLYEDVYLEGEDGSFGATLLLTAPSLFTSEKDLRERVSKLNGTYKASASFAQEWSWFKPVEMNVYGMIQPYGTFLHQRDGSYYGLFGYAEDGTVTISDGKDGGMHIEFDLVSQNGSKMKGSYDGPIDWSWQPVASASDDGTSTLTEDYDMDLSRHTQARLVAPQQIYIGGVGYTQMSEYSVKWGSERPSEPRYDDIGYQYIAFGNIGQNNNEDGSVNAGDFAYIELVTAPGEERQLKPGHYTISEQRWPAYFRPMADGEGVAVKGMLLQNTAWTSHWEHHYASEGGLSVIDGHAYFYGGEVTVSGPDDAGNYTFEFDCICVREHHVRGKWTGPVTGIADPDADAAAAAWHAPLLTPAQLRARNAERWGIRAMDAGAARELQGHSAPAARPVYARLSSTR